MWDTVQIFKGSPLSAEATQSFFFFLIGFSLGTEYDCSAQYFYYFSLFFDT